MNRLPRLSVTTRLTEVEKKVTSMRQERDNAAFSARLIHSRDFLVIAYHCKGGRLYGLMKLRRLALD